MASTPPKKIKKRSRASGAGVKAGDGVGSLARKQVLLDEHTETVALLIGNGNLSLGLREAVRRAAEHEDAGPFDPGRHLARSEHVSVA